jgi:dehydrodolichyl diphosphate syntase complex subunit NUS1
MAATASDIALYRRDVSARGSTLSAQEREKLIKPYLPTPPRSSSPNTQPNGRSNGVKAKRKAHRKRVRPFVKNKLHVLLYFLIHLIFGIYIRLRQIYHATIDRVVAIVYYHHRTPEYIQKDVKDLSRLPGHLSVLLTLKTEEDGGLEALLDEVAELCAWTAAVGIPVLSVYEKSGVLKSYMSSIQELVNQKLTAYFGPPPATPSLHIFAPNHPSTNTSSTDSQNIKSKGTTNDTTNGNTKSGGHLNLLLISSTDGRETLVDLTRTLTEMCQSNKISPRDITADLIDAEISATTSIASSESKAVHQPQIGRDSETAAGEPALLIIFGPVVKLDGYPPWQIRLTEIFCVGDSGGDVSGRSATRVEYQGFLRGLWKYAGAEMRFGR